MTASFKHKRLGAVAPLVAIGIIVLISMAAIGLDLGYIYMAREEMQNAADSSALAGASGLLKGPFVATGRAFWYGTKQVVAQEPVAINELNIVIGDWDGMNQAFTAGTGGLRTPNAVLAEGTRQDLKLFFAPILGVNDHDVFEDAIALNGAGVCAGIWGIENLKGHGDIVTDSFDSDFGNYGIGNINQNGDLCTCRDMTLNGSAQIYGDAMYGYGYSFVVNGGAVGISGIVDETSCAAPEYTADFAWMEANNDNASIVIASLSSKTLFNGANTDLKLVADDHLILSGGNYYFDSVKMSGFALIEVTGPTSIYVGGDADFSGLGIVNATGNPQNLKIYINGEDAKFAGGSAFAGGVMAKNSDVVFIGSNDLQGVVVGKTIDLGGTSNIHIDEAMVRDVFGISPVRPILIR